MRKCKICEELLPEDQFHRDRTKPDGMVKKCKTCVKIYTDELRMGIKLNYEERYARIKEAKQIGLSVERQITNDLLKSLGYDIDSELSIHEQFMIKHGLVKNEHQVN